MGHAQEENRAFRFHAEVCLKNPIQWQYHKCEIAVCMFYRQKKILEGFLKIEGVLLISEKSREPSANKRNLPLKLSCSLTVVWRCCI